MIKRIFHPIGQGAFYTERHENLNIVYDCGSKNKACISNPVVQSAFYKNENIDILFISHFDSDHVNKIAELKKHAKVKKVILPLLHDEHKNFLINTYRMLNINLLTLIQNPKKFFGNDTKIIQVRYVEDNISIKDNNLSLEVNNLIEGQEIDSGTILSHNNQTHKFNWIFIPYNYKYQSRYQNLEQKLSQNGFDVYKLKNNPVYTINEIEKDVGRGYKHKFKKIYNTLKKDGKDTCINENSLIVYSGIDAKCNSKIEFEYGKFQFKKESINGRISCIYTGDMDMNLVDIKTIYANYWEFVGTIQIPHHGAKKNFNKNSLSDKYYICPISTRKKNKHHPSRKVIADIITTNSYPILINEDSRSELKEYITII